MKIPHRLIAIGDIHGCFSSLKKLIEDKINIQDKDRIVFLGDYIDRGPKSKEALDYIIDLEDKGFDIVTLMGNHEKMMIDAFKESRNIPVWLLNGGKETLISLGLESADNLSDKYWNFLNGLEYYYTYEDFVFVHAGFNDKTANPFMDTYQMIWARNNQYNNPVFNGKKIIHGHTPIAFETCKSTVEQNKSVLNIDTGCFYKERPGCGILTALDVFTGTIYSV